MPNLAEYFDFVSDEELLSRIVSDTLTEEASMVAIEEARRRELSLPERSLTSAAQESTWEGDLIELVSGLSPQEAQILASLLQSAGVPSMTGDTNMVQANSFLSIAVGGCRVSVPESHFAEAKELLLAYRRGDFQLDEDFGADEGAA